MTATDQPTLPTDLACAWSDFRADYGFPSTLTNGQAYRLFKAGWDAANSNYDDDRGVQR